MKKISSFFINRHQDILRYLLLLLTALVITNWIPKVGEFEYEFSLGKPWKHKNLIAPFNFAIQKTPENLEAEKAEVLSSITPYYSYKKEIAEENQLKFTQSFNNQFQALRDSLNFSLEDSTNHVTKGIELLELLYNKGLIKVAPIHREGDNLKINLLRNNIAESVYLKSFYTIKDAYQIVIDSLNSSKELDADFLIPIIENAITYNITYDKKTTEDIKNEAIDNISTTRGVVQEGESIISKGVIVDKSRYAILQSFKAEYTKSITGEDTNKTIAFGYFILIALVITFYTLFIYLFYKELFLSVKDLSFVLLLILLMSYTFHWAVEANLPSYYVLPFCIVPIVLRTFFGARLALFTHIIIVLIAGFILPEKFSFLFLHLIAGMAALFANINARYWSQFFVSAALVLLTYVTGYFALTLIQKGTFDAIMWGDYAWLGVNVLLVLLAYPLIPIFERAFGLISEITLVELADLNKPLLKQLSIKAPGTFQHSLQVSNLAEAAANEVGANAMLVKVAALYHDIGKMNNAIYFIENQNTESNPHDDLQFEESAQIIIKHVRDGIDLAKKYRLPGAIIDFIRTHHGTMRVEYFYRSHLKNFPEKSVDEDRFRYPGPAPFSKETAILMMSDAVEAASKSLKNPAAEDIDKLIENIINHQMESNQFANCDITFKDITMIKKTFKHMVKNIYHVRIAYPEQTK